MFLNKNKVRVPAKGRRPSHQRNTHPRWKYRHAAGPVISEFNEAKVQTRIEGGSIFVAKDTIVATKGDVISTKDCFTSFQARKLKPMEAGLSLSYPTMVG